MMDHNNNSVFLKVCFGAHVPTGSVGGMMTGIAAYGNLKEGSTERECVVEVFRVSKLPKLKDQLTKWETFGFLRWDVTGPPD